MGGGDAVRVSAARTGDGEGRATQVPHAGLSARAGAVRAGGDLCRAELGAAESRQRGQRRGLVAAWRAGVCGVAAARSVSLTPHPETFGPAVFLEKIFRYNVRSPCSRGHPTP